MTLKDIRELLNLEQQKASVFTEESAIVKVVSEILPHLDECIIIRQNAVHRSGIPDFIICYIGRFIGLELKDNTGVQSSQQKEWERKIKQAGGYYVLADNVEPIINVLNHVWNESVFSRCCSGI